MKSLRMIKRMKKIESNDVYIEQSPNLIFNFYLYY